jgi:hypothetical protein
MYSSSFPNCTWQVVAVKVYLHRCQKSSALAITQAETILLRTLEICLCVMIYKYGRVMNSFFLALATKSDVEKFTMSLSKNKVIFSSIFFCVLKRVWKVCVGGGAQVTCLRQTTYKNGISTRVLRRCESSQYSCVW